MATHSQRIEQLEQGIADLRASLSVEVGTAVSQAVEALQQTLAAQIATSLESATKQLGEEVARFKNRGDDEGEKNRGEHSPREVERSFNRGRDRRDRSVDEGEDEQGFAGGFRGGGNWRTKKLDLPIFSGNNPDGWIIRAERFFQFYRLTEEEQVEAAVVSMDGDALLWYQWENRRRPISRWSEMKAMILRQFRSTALGSLQEQWLSLHQEGGVQEYRRRFIELLAPLEGIPENIAQAQFISKLKDDIKNELRILGPKSLDHAMDLAVQIEAKLSYNPKKRWEGRSFHSGSPTQLYTPSNHSQKSTYSSPSTHSVFSTSSVASPHYHPNSTQPPRSTQSHIPIAKPVGEIRRLSDKELQYKRERGLCFRCDEKWTVGHKCKKKELSVLLSHEEPEVEYGSLEDLDPFDTPTSPNPEPPQPEISLNSVMGISSPKTLKLAGTINGESVVVMVDPGATHNFISTDTVQHLQLPITPSKSFGVSLGTGTEVYGAGVCKAVPLFIQGVEVVEDYLPLQLGNSDLILGIEWLEKLGTMVTNWKTQKIQFKRGDATITLEGDPSLCRQGISLKAMMRTIKKEGGGYLVELNQLEGAGQAEQELLQSIPESLQPLIHSYAQVFHMPSGLPPKRGHEHAVILKQGTDPVSVRPYRYPQDRKSVV